MDLKDKERDLLFKAKNGDLESKKLLIKSLDPLINSQVAKYTGISLPIETLRLEAKSLASQAIDSYDPSKGTQLNTHTVNYLKKLSRFSTNYQNVGHIPEPRALMIGSYNAVKVNIEEEKGRPATAEEIADLMNVPLSEIDRLQTELRKDLSTTLVDDDEDDIGGFYQYEGPLEIDPNLKEAIMAVYWDSDNVDKKILEFTLGLNGSMRKKSKDITKLLSLTDSELKNRKITLAKKIREIV